MTIFSFEPTRRSFALPPDNPLNEEQKYTDGGAEVMPFKQIDISAKPRVFREATATGKIILKKETVELARKGRLEKGDAVSIASLMAVLGAKKTPEIVALAHQLSVEKTLPVVKLHNRSIEVTVTVSAHEGTGVEMEALTAVSVALLNVWDIVKQYEKDSSGQYPTTAIESIRVLKKTKGKK